MTHHQQAGREKLTKVQRVVLKKIRRWKRATPNDCNCTVQTFAALERKGMIQVETTFASIIFPRTQAFASITPLGRRTLSEAQT